MTMGSVAATVVVWLMAFPDFLNEICPCRLLAMGLLL
jgi:hypothetical protein